MSFQYSNGIISVVLSAVLSVVLSVAASLISVSYKAGYYVKEIEATSVSVKENRSQINELLKGHYRLLGILTVKYPNLNLRKYMEISSEKGTPVGVISRRLEVLKGKTPEQGKSYLMMKGYSKSQASTIYSPDKK